jgi:hypothetical protein
MPISKPVKKTVNIMDLVRRSELNVRLLNNYDIASMKAQIIDAGRILKAIICELVDGEYVVLSGFRRTWAGQELYADGSISADLKEALGKVDIIVYSNLTEKERLQLILDHGSEKPICRTETVAAVWRLVAQMYPEKDVIRQLYFALARYTGNERKLRELPSENDPRAREKALHKWLHGTVGNYIMAAMGMGQYVRDQFILTHKAEDGLLDATVGEKVEMRCSRQRIQELSQAKSTDDKTDAGWSFASGGKSFNELIERFKAEDAGGPTVEKITRLTAKQLEQMADNYQSDLAKSLCKRAAGQEAEGLADLDAEAFRVQAIIKVLLDVTDHIPKGQHTVDLHGLLSLISVGKAEQVYKHLSSLFPAAS